MPGVAPTATASRGVPHRVPSSSYLLLSLCESRLGQRNSVHSTVSQLVDFCHVFEKLNWGPSFLLVAGGSDSPGRRTSFSVEKRRLQSQANGGTFTQRAKEEPAVVLFTLHYTVFGKDRFVQSPDIGVCSIDKTGSLQISIKYDLWQVYEIRQHSP
ncbi:uncharacterized protein LOC119188280 [Rhipicephalus microplus]|uniref:uncharacterized protein LOC119188280 n=1 Tax=Rhipicephalus microplus TaxID=6941 RepID=UPI003F6D6495